MLLEAALWIPVMTLLIVGMVQFGKLTYVYYTLRKAVYSAARYLAVQPGVNFCDLAADTNVTAAIQFAISGASDGSGTPLISSLTADMFQVTAQCVDPGTGVAGACSETGCPLVPTRPDYIMVSMPTGYEYRLRIPVVTLDPVPLRPYALVAYEGGQ
jgi:hypothetical protein